MRPRPIITPVASPKLPLKMKFQKRPVTTGATAQGSSIATPSSFDPAVPRLTISAVMRASGRVSAVVAIANSIVRGIDARNSSSASIRSKLRSPTNGVSVARELHAPQAEPERREDRRDDEEPDDQGAGQEREQRESAVVEPIDPRGDPSRADDADVTGRISSRILVSCRQDTTRR